MIKWFVVLVIGVLPLIGYSQFGLNIKYLMGGSEILDQQNISQDGMQASIEYGFRLKKKRLEFHPGIGYRFTFNKSSLQANMNAVDLDFNTAIYPFDFGGDCDCPTWSKDGNIIKKGLFIEVSPGVSFQTIKRNEIIPDFGIPYPVSISSSNVLFKLGIGAGIDIGISESLTITPMLTYTTLSSADWDGLNSDDTAGTLDDQTYMGYGLRMVYKPNPKRLRRR